MPMNHRPSRWRLWAATWVGCLLLCSAGIRRSQPNVAPHTAPPAVAPSGGSRDPSGWRGARWGMSDDQVAGAFAGEVVKRDPPSRPGDGTYILYDIPNYAVDRDTFMVVFEMDSTTTTLTSVTLMDISGVTLHDAYDRISDALTRKYGAPTSSDTRKSAIGSITMSHWWIFATTIIDLTWWHPNSGPHILSVRYHPAADRTSRKL